eukprot:GILJ01039990.1.p1 GENE.GILJ01039990.1~~GILJ01039990.1.p1  ORF type:complete len:107 (-),score=24.91 GILJ01039990.1:29-325(-)
MADYHELPDELLIRLASVVSKDPSLLAMIESGKEEAVQQQGQNTDSQKVIAQLQDELKKEREEHAVTKTKFETIKGRYEDLFQAFEIVVNKIRPVITA